MRKTEQHEVESMSSKRVSRVSLSKNGMTEEQWEELSREIKAKINLSSPINDSQKVSPPTTTAVLDNNDENILLKVQEKPFDYFNFAEN